MTECGLPRLITSSDTYTLCEPWKVLQSLGISVVLGKLKVTAFDLKVTLKIEDFYAKCLANQVLCVSAYSMINKRCGRSGKL